MGYTKPPGQPPPSYDTPAGQERNAEAKARMAARAPKPKSALADRLSQEEALEGPNARSAAGKKLAGGFSVRDYSVPGEPHR